VHFSGVDAIHLQWYNYARQREIAFVDLKGRRIKQMKGISAIDLNNGDMIIKYGDDYVHCYNGWQLCINQILLDIKTYRQEGDTSYWDGNDPELIDIFESWNPRQILVEDEVDDHIAKYLQWHMDWSE